MADWSALPGSAVALIARRLQVIEDFIAFRSTCSSWLKATTLEDFDKSSCPKLPLLMLHEIENDHDDEIDKNEEVDQVNENYVIPDIDHNDDDDGNSDGDDSNSDDDDSNNDDSDGDDYEIYQNYDENFEIDDQNDEMETNIDEMEDKMDHRKDKMYEMIERRILGSLIQSKKDSETNDEAFPADANPKRHKGFPESNLDAQRKDPEPQVNHQRKFMSLSKGKRSMISLPKANGMECIGSKGWLIMVERRTGNMCLSHPITRAQIPLPKAPPHVNYPFLRCAVLSDSPSQTPDYIVMVAYVEPPFILECGYVGYWKPGNRTWTRIEIPYCVEDLNYYNGKFYALTDRSQVCMCDVSGPNPTNRASKIIELPWKWSRPKAQLVACGGRLLIVAPFFRYSYNLKSHHDLKMVELDVMKGSYSNITSLGSSAVFLGRNEGFSIDANRFPGIIQPNLIYFGDGSYRVAARGRNNVSRPRSGWGRGVWINI